jgi:glycosyltransferase involved in cell wall biosynthesis
MDRSEIALVIPAFNEAATIGSVVNAASKYGQPIVVNDCSTDETASLAKAAGAIVVNHVINRGYDSALNSGFKEAFSNGYQYIITLDADGQHDPSLLIKFIDKLKCGSPIVLGVRNSKARIAEHIFAVYTRFRFGILDPLCGMKGYRKDVYESVGYFDSYKSIGTELMLRAISSGCSFEQIPFNVKQRADKPRFDRAFSANLRILRALYTWFYKGTA